MSVASDLGVRLADGSEVPTGAPAHLLSLFDVWSPPFDSKILGRRALTSALSTYLGQGRAATDAELNLALEPLLARGFIQSRGNFTARSLRERYFDAPA